MAEDVAARSAAEKLRKIAELHRRQRRRRSPRSRPATAAAPSRRRCSPTCPARAGAFQWFAELAAETSPTIVDAARAPVPAVGELRARTSRTACAPASCRGTSRSSWRAGRSLPRSRPATRRCSSRRSFTSLTALELAKVVRGGRPPARRRQHHRRSRRHASARSWRSNPLVDKVAFTGSTEVGRRIMQLASGTVKPVTLELGGKSANIVLDDADLDIAAAGVLWGTFFHNGQVCESGTRALVHASDLRRVRRPARRPRRQDRHRRQHGHGHRPRPARVAAARSRPSSATWSSASTRSASRSVGGSKPDDLRRRPRPGRLLPADDLRGVDNSTKIAQEEIFGPVLCVIPFDSDDEAIAIANDSIYGLGGGVQSRQPRPGQGRRRPACAPAPCGSTTTT